MRAAKKKIPTLEDLQKAIADLEDKKSKLAELRANSVEQKMWEEFINAPRFGVDGQPMTPEQHKEILRKGAEERRRLDRMPPKNLPEWF